MTKSSSKSSSTKAYAKTSAKAEPSKKPCGCDQKGSKAQVTKQSKSCEKPSRSCGR